MVSAGFVSGFWTVLGVATGLFAIVLLSYVPIVLLACWAAARDAWDERKARKVAERFVSDKG